MTNLMRQEKSADHKLVIKEIQGVKNGDLNTRVYSVLSKREDISKHLSGSSCGVASHQWFQLPANEEQMKLTTAKTNSWL